MNKYIFEIETDQDTTERIVFTKDEFDTAIALFNKLDIVFSYVDFLENYTRLAEAHYQTANFLENLKKDLFENRKKYETF